MFREAIPEAGSGRKVDVSGASFFAEPIIDGLSLTSADGYIVGFFRVMWTSACARCKLKKVTMFTVNLTEPRCCDRKPTLYSSVNKMAFLV